MNKILILITFLLIIIGVLSFNKYFTIYIGDTMYAIEYGILSISLSILIGLSLLIRRLFKWNDPV